MACLVYCDHPSLTGADNVNHFLNFILKPFGILPLQLVPKDDQYNHLAYMPARLVGL